MFPLQLLPETTDLVSEEKVDPDAEQTIVASPIISEVSKDEENVEVEGRPKSIPPPGSGQRIYEIDPTLKGFSGHLDYR